ncbi:MAG: PQQ-like beta-propeller repeat protein [Planctomycetia bacterium]|nr:PQQ-like beta-propeller repeat protein [Planctomycetia bacterium]
MKQTLLTISLLAVLSLSSLHGDDWPAFRGIHRDGKSAEKGLLTQWPEKGPALLWKATGFGSAMAGPAIKGDRMFCMGQTDDGQFTYCHSLKDGKQLWSRKNGAIYKNGMGDGPRCTPTLDGELLYVLGANGDLQCLNQENGEELWKLNILEEFGGENIVWGISESPLVIDNKVIVMPGGTGGTLVALDKSNGRVIWRSRDPNHNGAEQAGYASAQVITVGNMQQVVTFTSKGAVGVQLNDGKFLWRFDKMANSTANCSMPVFFIGKILYSSDYGTGCALIDLKPDGSAEEVYFNKNFKNHHGGYVLVDEHVYGFDSNVLVCMEWKTGKILWKDRSVGKGSVTYADGMLYVLSENGTMGLVKAVPTGYQEVSRFKMQELSGKPTWVYPVVAAGKLYLRDQDKIWCFDVKAK